MTSKEINLVIKENKDLIADYVKIEEFRPNFGEWEWTTPWYNDKDPIILYPIVFYTAFVQINVKLCLYKLKDKFSVNVEVKSQDRSYKKLEALSYTENYNDFKIEYFIKAIKYCLKIKRVINQKEDMTQKTLGSAVREGLMLKDFC